MNMGKTLETFEANRFTVTILVRLLIILLLLGGLAYAALFALATLVEPDVRETTITIPSSKFDK